MIPKNNQIKNRFLISKTSLQSSSDVEIEDLSFLYILFKQLEFICQKNNHISLHSSQIGINLKAFVIKNKNEFEYYFNCKYEPIGKMIKSIESCLSFQSNQRFECERFEKVRVIGKKFKIVNDDFEVEEFDATIDGLLSIQFQHEIDHDEVKLIDKTGLEIDFYVK